MHKGTGYKDIVLICASQAALALRLFWGSSQAGRTALMSEETLSNGLI